MGRDLQHRGLYMFRPVSIHAPAWGATRYRARKARRSASFNPRARMGRDSPPLYKNANNKVSIHAPAWGATCKRYWLKNVSKFQSTRPHGARRRLKRALPQQSKFQSTRPHGARRSMLHLMARAAMFQSTRPHGARRKDCIGIISRGMFQSTRPHGARRADYSSVKGKVGFNPRARMGRDHCCRSPHRSWQRVSIHAPAWGATRSN